MTLLLPVLLACAPGPRTVGVPAPAPATAEIQAERHLLAEIAAAEELLKNPAIQGEARALLMLRLAELTFEHGRNLQLQEMEDWLCCEEER